jgi:hypothetical protein
MDIPLSRFDVSECVTIYVFVQSFIRTYILIVLFEYSIFLTCSKMCVIVELRMPFPDRINCDSCDGSVFKAEYVRETPYHAEKHLS